MRNEASEHLLDVFDRLGRPRMLVVGDLILDRYTWGNAERVSQEAPVILLRADRREQRLGGAANVCQMLRGLEAEVACVGVVGDDNAGRQLRELLAATGIDVAGLVIDPERPTTEKERFIGRAANRHGHQILRVDTEERAAVEGHVERALIEQLERLCEADVSRWSSDEHDYTLADELPSYPDFPETTPSESYRETIVPITSDWRNALATQSVIAEHGDVMPQPEDAQVCPFDAILVSDYDKGVCTPAVMRAVTALGRKLGVPVVVDPGRGVDWSKYRGATAIKANRVEAELAVERKFQLRAAKHGEHGPLQLEDPFDAGVWLCRELELGLVVITLDRDGAVLVESNAHGRPGRRADDFFREHFATRARDVYDITGAGDMVLAMIGVALAANVSAADAVRLGNVAGGLEVEKEGVVVIPRAEIRQDLLVELGAPPAEAGKILPLDRLAAQIAEHRAAGQRVVFTNGCFDLLHVGHITSLEEAASQGEILVVAVNSDSSVRKLKGSGRPLIAEQDRARMLAALSVVDYVLIFNEDTPLQAIRRLRPHVLVKGGTYAPGQVVGQDFVESYGGRLYLSRMVDGISTTNLVNSIHGMNGPHYLRRGIAGLSREELDITKD
ncbi:MAG: D-glycero-beta-D-manno-heptose 1-phosphate adenylyltransferase [Planctomycetia bacterium]|nr:D-glycero-beta-D-manno-heptose 1-phosphate adenylyltransferase [Planctomycetia bacterium]